MNCETFESRLNDQLDARSKEVSVEITDHAAECEACADMLLGYTALLQVVDPWEVAEPAGDFTQNVLSNLTGPVEAPAEVSLPVATDATSGYRALSWRDWSAFASSAALLALILGSSLLWFRGPQQSPSKPALTAAAPLNRPASRPPVEVAAIPPSSPSTDSPTVDQPPIEPLPEEYREWLLSLRRSLPETYDAPSLDANQLPDGIRPIANSLGSALHLLRSTLPGGKSGSNTEKPQAMLLDSGELILG